MNIDELIESCKYEGSLTQCYDKWVLEGSEESFDDFCFNYTGVILAAFCQDNDYNYVINKLNN